MYKNVKYDSYSSSLKASYIKYHIIKSLFGDHESRMKELADIKKSLLAK